MASFELPVLQVTIEVLERLVANGVMEDLQLEYKEKIPEKRDSFLSSITAFANTAGGDLICGIRTKQEDGQSTGEPEAVVGIEGNLDQEKLRLEQWIQDCIEPRPVVSLKMVERAAGPPCLLIRVQRNWSGLCMVKTMSNPFYGRNSGGKYPLSVTEIKAGFVLGETARDRVREFHKERIARVQAGEFPTNAPLGPKIIFHALPLSPNENVWACFRSEEREAAVIKNGVRIYLELNLISGTLNSFHYNSDGFVAYTEASHHSYIQVFRDGGIESVDGNLLQPKGLTDREDPHKVIHGINIERGVIRAFTSYQRFCKRVGVSGPIALHLALTEVRGYGIVPKGGYEYDWEFIEFDRDPLVSPDVVMDNVSNPAGPTLKPLFDFIWNAGGYPESPHYKEEQWIGDLKN